METQYYKPALCLQDIFTILVYGDAQHLRLCCVAEGLNTGMT
jgi:hypothetical protein